MFSMYKKKRKRKEINAAITLFFLLFVLFLYRKQDDEQCEGNLITFALFMHA
jgi:hypothetical protein